MRNEIQKVLKNHRSKVLFIIKINNDNDLKIRFKYINLGC